MQLTALPSRTGDHFAAIDLGDLVDLDRFSFQLPHRHLQADGKVFLKQLLRLTGAEISLNKLPVGKSLPFYHKHQVNEEIYIFLRGEGEFQVDGTSFPVREGTVIRVDCEGERCWRNRSAQDLYYIVIQVHTGSCEQSTVEDGIRVAKPVQWVD
ncbi:MAG TPA: cupin domain-containing protein [Microcoleaceae cyanobacterium]|jgi:mannose-6-phosphate isomerase-like protein (cupin superfamily)